MDVAEVLMVPTLQAAMGKTIIRLIILGCIGLTFKPHMEKVKAEPHTKSFLWAKERHITANDPNCAKTTGRYKPLAHLAIYIHDIVCLWYQLKAILKRIFSVP